MKINLNDTVRFKLTDYGKTVANYKIDHEYLDWCDNKATFSYYKPGIKDCGNGYFEMQLWRFMKLFGDCMEVGTSCVVTENNNLEVDHGGT